MFNYLAHFFTPHTSNNHRPKLLQPAGFAVLIALILVTNSTVEVLKLNPPSTGLVLGYSSSINPSDVLEQTNLERLKLGLPSLKLNKYLNQAAQAKAENMFQNDYWDHIAPDGTTPWSFIKSKGYKYSVAGENLARDFQTTSPMVKAWMDSPTHRANIVHTQYTDTGIAVVNGRLEGVDTTLVVQMFGAPPITAASTPPEPELLPEAESVVNAELTAPQPQVAAAQSQAPVTIEISPTTIKSTIALSVALILAGIIILDEIIVQKRKTIRLVGRNLAHLSFLFAVIILILSLSQPGGIL